MVRVGHGGRKLHELSVSFDEANTKPGIVRVETRKKGRKEEKKERTNVPPVICDFTSRQHHTSSGRRITTVVGFFFLCSQTAQPTAPANSPVVNIQYYSPIEYKH